MEQRETPKKVTKMSKETPYTIVDLFDLDPEQLSFTAPKTNKYGGKYVGIKYGGKSLLVKTPRRTVLFGATPNTELNGTKITGYSVQLSFGKDYENDPLFQKCQQLDEYFVETCINNSVLWGLGGTPKKPVGREVIEGDDDRGLNGKWRRLVKWAAKKDKTTNECAYLDYPPRFEVKIPCSLTDHKDD